MLSHNKLIQILAIILLIFLQITIFNNINFMGIANPFVYIIFILLLPLDNNRYLTLLYAFVLGIGVDLFEMTGGINAFATVLIAFMRPFFIKVINMGNYEEAESVKLFRFNFLQWILYLFILIFVHHFTVILLEQFSFDFIQRNLTQTAIGSSITLIIAGIYIMLFPPRRTSEF